MLWSDAEIVLAKVEAERAACQIEESQSHAEFGLRQRVSSMLCKLRFRLSLSWLIGTAVTGAKFWIKFRCNLVMKRPWELP